MSTFTQHLTQHGTASIRRRLLIFLLPPLTALLLIGVFVDFRAALVFAHKTYDQRLTDAALALAARIDASKGEIPQDLLPRRPPTSGVERDPDFSFSIVGPQGQWIAGDRRLQAAPRGATNPSFLDATLAGKAVRVSSYELATTTGPITVSVAGADDSRTGPAHFVLGSTWLIGFIQLDITLLLVWIGVHFGLKPLLRLRQDIESRSARELRPLDLAPVPAEVRPLVEGLNQLFAMLGEAARAQRQFVADTAHQLRTPLAGLLGHLDVMMQEPAAAPLRDRLKALHEGMTALAHSANQLLSLARTDPAASLADRFASVDLKALGERILERNLDRSLQSQHDLGADLQPAQVSGNVRLLEDLLGNLVDNALHYTPPGGHVTVRCGSANGQTFLEVEDDGPGIPEAERTHVRKRFYRMPGSVGHGCGLGLAIVDEISRLHDADLTIESGANGRGTRIRASFRGPASENHVAIRRSVMPNSSAGSASSAPSKLASLESALVNGNSALNRTTPEARTVSQSADHTLTAISFAARSSRGYSLVELIVTMTIVAIVIGIAVPSYKYVTNSNRVSAEVNLLLGDLQYARSEAVKEGSTVTVCPSNNANTSTPSCLTTGANWNTGWLVFSDINASGALDTGAQLLRAQPGFSPSTDTFVSSDPGVKFVSFNREGFTTIPTTDMTTNGGLLIKLNVATPNVQWERCLLLSYVGVMQTLRGGTSPCT
jgi:two-component system, OmpR family, sensor histidine kinase TctE